MIKIKGGGFKSKYQNALETHFPEQQALWADSHEPLPPATVSVIRARSSLGGFPTAVVCPSVTAGMFTALA